MASQSQMKQERLMQAAEDNFMKLGYKAVSLDQIALEAGISKMTIYKHFPSKEELFIEVLIRVTARYIKEIEDELSKLTHTVEKMRFLSGYSVRNVAAISMTVYRDVIERPRVMAAVTEYKQKWAETLWRNILQTGIDQGEIRPLDLDFMVTLLMNLPMAFMNSDSFSSHEKINQFLLNFYDFIEYGLLGIPEADPKDEEAQHG